MCTAHAYLILNSAHPHLCLGRAKEGHNEGEEGGKTRRQGSTRRRGSVSKRRLKAAETGVVEVGQGGGTSKDGDNGVRPEGDGPTREKTRQMSARPLGYLSDFSNMLSGALSHRDNSESTFGAQTERTPPEYNELRTLEEEERHTGPPTSDRENGTLHLLPCTSPNTPPYPASPKPASHTAPPFN